MKTASILAYILAYSTCWHESPYIFRDIFPVYILSSIGSIISIFFFPSFSCIEQQKWLPKTKNDVTLFYTKYFPPMWTVVVRPGMFLLLRSSTPTITRTYPSSSVLSLSFFPVFFFAVHYSSESRRSSSHMGEKRRIPTLTERIAQWFLFLNFIFSVPYFYYYYTSQHKAVQWYNTKFSSPFLS